MTFGQNVHVFTTLPQNFAPSLHVLWHEHCVGYLAEEQAGTVHRAQREALRNSMSMLLLLLQGREGLWVLAAGMLGFLGGGSETRS